MSGHCRTALARMLSGDAFRSNLKRGLANRHRENNGFDWLNDVTNLRHNTFTMSASSNKIEPAFHLLRCLFASESVKNA